MNNRKKTNDKMAKVNEWLLALFRRLRLLTLLRLRPIRFRQT